MNKLQQDDDDAYRRQFSQYIKNGVTAETVSLMCCLKFYVFNLTKGPMFVGIKQHQNGRSLPFFCNLKLSRALGVNRPLPHISQFIVEI